MDSARDVPPPSAAAAAAARAAARRRVRRCLHDWEGCVSVAS